jgi:hypothetical protein
MTTQTAQAIRVQGLEKSYKELRVLRGVDFDVTRGSIFALLGSNGAGKTTVVKILSTRGDGQRQWLRRRHAAGERPGVHQPYGTVRRRRRDPQRAGARRSRRRRHGIPLRRGSAGMARRHRNARPVHPGSDLARRHRVQAARAAAAAVKMSNAPVRPAKVPRPAARYGGAKPGGGCCARGRVGGACWCPAGRCCRAGSRTRRPRYSVRRCAAGTWRASAIADSRPAWVAARAGAVAVRAFWVKDFDLS